MSLLYAVLACVAIQRIGELVLARRNARYLIARGGVEYGAGHYPVLVALHLAWLAAMAVLIDGDAPADWRLLGVYAALQLARYWVISSLARRWTTRIIVVPGQAPVRSGPYRFMRHPNYAVVATEIALLPLAFGAWGIALAFSLANAAILAWRIRVENAALARANP